MWTKGHQSNQFFSTREELAEAVVSLGDTPGVYMACNSYGELDKRTQDNVAYVAALYVDLDAGAEKFAKAPTKAYETQQEALLALAGFSKAVGMTPTLVVSSGLGLHAYWKLDQDYPAAEAKPIMEKFKLCTKALGLKADPAVTADTARVLRPVGTVHSVSEDGTVRRVAPVLIRPDRTYSMDVLLEKLLPYRGTTQEAPKERNINDDVLTYPQSNNSIVKGATHCVALAQVRDARGQVSEPLWRAMLGIAVHCNKDGNETAHAWSQGDPRYSEQNTDVYMARWKAGPTTCATFADNCDACASCAYAGKVTSPIQLCRVDADPVAEPEATTEPEPVEADAIDNVDATLEERRPDLFVQPEGNGFFFARHGSTWRLYARLQEEIADAAGDKVKVWVNRHVADRLFCLESCTSWTTAEGATAQVEWVTASSTTKSKESRFHMPANLFSDVRAFARKALDVGVIFTNEKNAQPLVMAYMNGEYRRVQHMSKFNVKEHFGFHWHEGEFLFAYGEHAIHADGSIERVAVHPNLRGVPIQLATPGFLPEKNSGRWSPLEFSAAALPAAKRYAELIRMYFGSPQHRRHRLAIALGLSSPYLVFSEAGKLTDTGTVPAGGCVVSLYGATGKGKTTLQNIIAAAYTSGGAMMGGGKSGATPIAIKSVAGSLGYMPLVLDELSQVDAPELARLTESLANGEARVRATRAGTVPEANASYLVTVMSSNIPHAQVIAAAEKNTEALLHRVVELDFDEFDDPTGVAGADYNKARAAVLLEGGAVGMLLAYAAVKYGPERMAEIAADAYKQCVVRFDMTGPMRFYSRIITAALLANRILGKLGVDLFSEEDIIEEFAVASKDLSTRVRLGRMTVEDTFNQMLSDLSKNIAVTATYPIPGRPGTEASKSIPLLNERTLQVPLVGRQIVSEGRLLLAKTAVNSWLTSRRIPADQFLKKLVAVGKCSASKNGDYTQRRSLTSGVSWLAEMPRVACYEFNLKDRNLFLIGGKDKEPQPFEDEHTPIDDMIVDTLPRAVSQ